MRISTLTTKEEVLVRSTIHALNNDKFLCYACHTRYPSKEKIETYKEQYRCEKPASFNVHEFVQNGVRYKFNRCIGNYFSTAAVSWLETTNQMDKGILPYPGGYLNQPNKAIEVMRIIKGEQLALSRKREEEQARKMNRGKR